MSRWHTGIVVGAIALMQLLPGSEVQASAASKTTKQAEAKMTVHYVEIVTDDQDGAVALYQRMLGVSFGPVDADLGQARVATRPDGTLIGIRKPLAAHEQSIVRTYFAVDDIQKAAKEAEAAGATIAYPPTKQGSRGTFAIVIQGGLQYGLWQR